MQQPISDALQRCERCGEIPEIDTHTRCERCKIDNPFKEAPRPDYETTGEIPLSPIRCKWCGPQLFRLDYPDRVFICQRCGVPLVSFGPVVPYEDG